MSGTETEPAKKVVLICDDNAPLVGLMRHLLIKHGYRVETAGDGAEGLALVEAVKPDLLLLDLMMPVVDGFSVLEGLRKLPGKRPYAMVVSGHEGKDRRERSVALGADETWTKPFNFSDLLGRVDALVKKGLV